MQLNSSVWLSPIILFKKNIFILKGCKTPSFIYEDIRRALFRFYPTDEQKMVLAQTFGCVRFAYNYMLRLRTDAWYKEQKHVGYHATSAALTTLKKQPEFCWLNEVSSVPVQQSLMHLQTAFKNFFSKRAKYPTFKRKHDKQAVSYVATDFSWDGKALKLAKMAEPLLIRWSRTPPKASKLTTVTVSKDAAERYFVSLLCDDAVNPKLEVSGKVGINLGLTHFAILSTGEKIPSPNTFRKNESRLATLQRRLAKKIKGSANRLKAKLKVARIHAKTADSRRDFLHKLSTWLINENQVIAIETLASAICKRTVVCRNASVMQAGQNLTDKSNTKHIGMNAH